MATERQKQTRRVVTSFMLRFVYEAEVDPELPDESAEPEENQPGLNVDENSTGGWRGVVKHIQSGAEHHFMTLAEAEAFIKRYIKEENLA